MKKLLPLILCPFISYGALSEPEENSAAKPNTCTAIIKYTHLNPNTPIKCAYNIREERPDIYWTLKIVEGYIGYFEGILSTHNKSFPTVNGKLKDSTSPDGKESFDRVFSLSKNYIMLCFFNEYFMRKHKITMQKYIESTKRQKQFFESLSVREIDANYKQRILRDSGEELFDKIEEMKTEIDRLFTVVTFKFKPVIDAKKITHTLGSFAYANMLFFRGAFTIGYYQICDYYKSSKDGYKSYAMELMEKFMELRRAH